MNTSLRLNRIQTVQVSFASLEAFFQKLFAGLARLRKPADDPAALRYIASKYYGEID